MILDTAMFNAKILVLNYAAHLEEKNALLITLVAPQPIGVYEICKSGWKFIYGGKLKKVKRVMKLQSGTDLLILFHTSKA